MIDSLLTSRTRVVSLALLACMLTIRLSADVAAEPADPLASLFPPEAMQDRATLDLKRIEDVSDEDFRRVTYEYTTFEWGGETWRTKAVAIIPKTILDEHKGAVVLVVGNQANALAMAQQGFVAIALTAGAPGTHFGISNSGALMAHGQKKALETGDPRWLGYAWLGKIFVRSVTAAQALGEFAADRFMVTGGSKWGAGSWIACAADERIVAAVPTAWNMGNMAEGLAIKARRRGLDFAAGPPGAKGPGFASVRQQLAAFQHPNGAMSGAHQDPYEFRDRLANKKVLYIAGANDPLFHPLAQQTFLPHLPGDIRSFLAPNGVHGTSPWNPIATRMWLAHVFDGRDVPRIEVSGEASDGQLQVLAKVTTKTNVTSVQLWTCDDTLGKYVTGSIWTATPMRPSGTDTYTASVPLPTAGVMGYLVMVEDDDAATVPGVMTSEFQEFTVSALAAIQE